MTEHAVVIAGGGPTGLMLAGELALSKVDVAIVERRASQDLAGSRAGHRPPTNGTRVVTAAPDWPVADQSRTARTWSTAAARRR